MATYRGIKGWSIQTVSSDPPSPVTGQVWYNSTLGKLKGFKEGAGNWATGNSLNTARGSTRGAGTQTAGLMFGGDQGDKDHTETYDGTTWTEVGDLSTGRAGSGGCGATQTAALCVGGEKPGSPDLHAITETWNGTSWTEVADLNTARKNLGAAGTTTSAIAFGGSNDSDDTETWDGSSWTDAPNLGTGRYQLAGAGASGTAAIAFGGISGPTAKDEAEKWDGTSWTEVADLNTGRSLISGNGSTSTAAIAIGGRVPPPGTKQTHTETWDGTSWTEQNNIPTATHNGGTAGTTTAAVFAGGDTGSVTNASFEWNDPFEETVSFTAS